MTEQADQAEARRWSEQLRALPSQVRAELDAADAQTLRQRPAPGEWSAIEVLGHLVDKMQVWRERVEQVAREERPFLASYDQDARVREQGYQSAEVHELLTLLRQACERFARTVEALPETALAREGIHEETGPITLEQCVRVPVASADDHLAQMRAAIANANR